MPLLRVAQYLGIIPFMDWDRRLLIAQIAEPVWYEFVKRGLLT